MPWHSVPNQKCCSRKCHFLLRTKSIEERFWPKVDKSDGCWLWKAATNQQGYGNILYKGRVQLAHRVAWLMSGRALETNQKLLHYFCDIPSCIRPEHMKLGTQADNIRDMHRKGRALKGYHGRSIRMRQWKLILSFYKHCCALCGRNDIKLVKDHYLPLAKGGKTHWTNIWPLCMGCNGNKSTSIINGQLPHIESLRRIIESHQSSRERRGIYWNSARHIWRVQVYLNRKNVQVGSFRSEADATRAFRAASPELTI